MYLSGVKLDCESVEENLKASADIISVPNAKKFFSALTEWHPRHIVQARCQLKSVWGAIKQVPAGPPALADLYHNSTSSSSVTFKQTPGL